MYKLLQAYTEIITSFIFPKYTLSNAEEYNSAVKEMNSKTEKTMYMVPILESRDIVEDSTRYMVLSEFEEKIDSVKKYVLNIRVGGNGFSNEFAARRHCDETIYDVLPIAQLLGDILTVFSGDYVVSGPVGDSFPVITRSGKRGSNTNLSWISLMALLGRP